MTILGPSGPTWEDVLDDLEFQVDAAERLIARGDAAPYSDYSWAAPRLAEPLPAPLRERAAALLARQQHAIAAAATARTQAGRQRAVTERIGQAIGRGGSRPIYLDTSA